MRHHGRDRPWPGRRARGTAPVPQPRSLAALVDVRAAEPPSGAREPTSAVASTPLGARISDETRHSGGCPRQPGWGPARFLLSSRTAGRRAEPCAEVLGSLERPLPELLCLRRCGRATSSCSPRCERPGRAFVVADPLELLRSPAQRSSTRRRSFAVWTRGMTATSTPRRASAGRALPRRRRRVRPRLLPPGGQRRPSTSPRLARIDREVDLSRATGCAVGRQQRRQPAGAAPPRRRGHPVPAPARRRRGDGSAARSASARRGVVQRAERHAVAVGLLEVGSRRARPPRRARPRVRLGASSAKRSCSVARTALGSAS